MNSLGFTSNVTKDGDKNVFSLIDCVGRCVGKIFFQERIGRMGNIYEIPLLGTSNGGDELDKLNITGVEKVGERIPGLLYILFKVFIDYLKTLDNEEFSININQPLLTLTTVYKKLSLALSQSNHIESGVVQPQVVVFKC